MSSSPASALSLYRSLLRTARQFPHYNYRNYAVRRVREEFAANRALGDATKIHDQLRFGREQLALMQRQSTIGQLYSSRRKIVIELDD